MRKAADRLGAELVNFGGFAMSRTQAYHAMIDDGWDHKTASYYAFGALQTLTPKEAAGLIPAKLYPPKNKGE